MKSGLVSIVVPTYNVGDVVSETIQSVLSQTYENWELILVDDASTDNTVSVLNTFCLKDPRITVLNNTINSGPGVSRNVGIERAQGQYLAFLDSDDLWLEDKLSKQIDFMKSNHAGISHTSFSFIDSNGLDRKGRVDVSRHVTLEDNLKRTEIGTSTALIDREIVKKTICFSSMRARQDLKLWIQLLGAGYSSLGLNVPLVKYRVRSGSVSSNKVKMLYVTFKVYLSICQLSLPKRIFYYFCYVVNAIKKRGE